MTRAGVDRSTVGDVRRAKVMTLFMARSLRAERG